jgi:hypothetical protein
MPAALRKIRLRAAQSIARVTGAIGCGSTIAAARQPIYAGRQLAMPHYQATFKIECAERSLALYSMHESAFRFARELRALLWLRAPGCCSVRFLFWRRPMLSVIRWLLQRLLRLLSGLLPELLRLRVGWLLSALVAASVLRRVLWRLAGARLGRQRWVAWRRRTRLAWRRTGLAWSPLT